MPAFGDARASEAEHARAVHHRHGDGGSERPRIWSTGGRAGGRERGHARARDCVAPLPRTDAAEWDDVARGMSIRVAFSRYALLPGNVSAPIVSSGLWLRTEFGASGVVHRPRFCRGLQVAWSDVEFVSLTPAMVREGGHWREERNSLLGPDFQSTLATARLIVLGLVVRDQGAVLKRTDQGLNRLWAGAALVPLVDAEGRFERDRGLLTLRIYERRLSLPLDALLDLIASHCRFDLVVDF